MRPGPGEPSKVIGSLFLGPLGGKKVIQITFSGALWHITALYSVTRFRV